MGVLKKMPCEEVLSTLLRPWGGVGCGGAGWRGERVAARAEEPHTTSRAEELFAGDGFGGRESQFSLVQSLVG